MEISLKEASRSLDKFKSVIEANSFRQPPKWLDYNATSLSAKVMDNPSRDDIDLPVVEQLIVELYSK